MQGDTYVIVGVVFLVEMMSRYDFLPPLLACSFAVYTVTKDEHNSCGAVA